MTEKKTNSKTNGQNGKENGQKIIPKNIWKAFYAMWDSTEYEELDAKRMKELLGKYMFIPLPKDVRNRKAIDGWFARMKELREKGKPFGGKTVSFKDDKTPLEDVFGKEDLSPTLMNKKLWDYIKGRKV